MKTNTFFKHLTLLILALITSTKVSAQEAYAVVTMEDGNAKSVAFYYDTNKSSFVGTDVTIVDDLNATNVYQNWAAATLTNVTFDPSFKNYTGLTTLYYWFFNCSGLTTINGLTNLNTDNVTNMAYMFYGCSSLTELDLSNFSIDKLTNALYMFQGCSKLHSIYANADTDWSSSEKLTGSSGMFYYCWKLTGGNGTICTSSVATDKTYARIDGLGGEPGFFSVKGAVRPYAILTSTTVDDVTTTAITFYYDDQLDNRQAANPNATVVTHLNSVSGSPDWATTTLTSVTFDDSFANYHGLTGLNCWFNNCSGLTVIEGLTNLNTENVTTMTAMFYYCSGLTQLDLSNINTSNVNTMYRMFYCCRGLTELDLSGFNTKNVNTMYQMFYGCSGLTELDLSAFNTVNVNTMYQMFYGCSGLKELDISGFNTANVTTMASMFQSCSRLIEVNLGDISIENLENTSNMFANCSDLQTIYAKAGTDWSTSTTLTSSSSMFNNCSKLMGSNGTDFSYTNANDKTYARIDSGTAAPGYFTDPTAPRAYALLSADKTTVSFYYDQLMATRKAAPENAGATFILKLNNNDSYVNTAWASSTLENVTFDTSFANYKGLTYLNRWFYGCSGLTEIDLSNLNTENVTTMQQMFNSCSNLQAIYAKAGTDWSTSTTLANSSSMFSGCSKLVGGDGTTYNSSITDKTYARIDGGTAAPGYFTDPTQPRAYALLSADKTAVTFYYDTELATRRAADPDATIVLRLNYTNTTPIWATASLTSVTFDDSFKNYRGLTSLYQWFFNCTGLTQLDLSNLNTENVNTMYQMFYGCSSLTAVDLSGFNTSNVTSMEYMFRGCSSLTELDLSSLNTENVTTMESMFYGCSALKEVNLLNFFNDNLENTTYMFYNCSKLQTIYAKAGTNLSTSETLTNYTSMFGSCGNLVGGNGTSHITLYANDKAYARIDGLDGRPGYFTDPNAPRPYAMLSADKTAVNFYYDTEMPTRRTAYPDATVVLTMNYTNTTPVWATASLTTVTIHEAFKDYHGLTGLNCWFYNCSGLTGIEGLTNLNTENVTTMAGMFSGCSGLTELNLSNLNTENVNTMASMFYGCSGLTKIDISGFNTAKVTTMLRMFYTCSGLTEVNLGDISIESLTNAQEMFGSCGNLLTIFAKAGTDWSTSETLTNSRRMFIACRKLAGGNETSYNDQNITNTYARIDGLGGEPGYFTDPTAPRAYAMLSADKTAVTFYYDHELYTRRAAEENADVTFVFKLNNNIYSSISNPDWATTSLTSVTFDNSFAEYDGLTGLCQWFSGCSGLTQIDLSNLNTDNVTTMSYMFYRCSGLTEVNLDDISIEKLENASNMFNSCTNLKTIYAKAGTDWSTNTTLTNSENMFYGCSKLAGGNGTVYNFSFIDKSRARIDGGTEAPGYFTDSEAFLLGDVNGDGSITIADVTALVNIILGKDTENQYNHQAADVNSDGSITIADVTALVNIILGKN